MALRPPIAPPIATAPCSRRSPQPRVPHNTLALLFLLTCISATSLDVQNATVCDDTYLQCLACLSTRSRRGMVRAEKKHSLTLSMLQGFMRRAPLREGEQPTNSDTTIVELGRPVKSASCGARIRGEERSARWQVLCDAVVTALQRGGSASCGVGAGTDACLVSGALSDHSRVT